MNQKKDNIKEKELENIIKLLQDLPKVDAPDNFEYNLMVRIQNKNFGNIKENKFNKWLYIFTPASVAVVATFLVVFFLRGNIKNYDDPFTFEPPVKVSSITDKIDTLEIKEFIVGSSDNKTTISENAEGIKESKLTVKQKSYQVVVQSNDVVTKTGNVYPLDDSKSVDLDKVLSGEKAPRSVNSRVRLVNQGENYYPFDEFIVKQNRDSSVKNLKARMDSIKKAGNRNQNK